MRLKCCILDAFYSLKNIKRSSIERSCLNKMLSKTLQHYNKSQVKDLLVINVYICTKNLITLNKYLFTAPGL